MVRHTHTRFVGKSIKKLMRLRGGGSALPGLVVEKMDPDFLARSLADLPHGVVVISGTNGKTTTTKMLTQLLRAHGLRVFTNPSGSNFTRGIVASLIDKVDEHGKLDADIAVLELDEAHAVHFVRTVKPRYSLILNVLRDQLDRFGEIDHTAKLLKKVVDATTDGVILNREDSLVRGLAPEGKKPHVSYFGLSADLQSLFPSDAEMHGGKVTVQKVPSPRPEDVILTSIDKREATFSFGTKVQKPVELKVDGVYNVLNAAGALALARMILGAKDKESSALLEELKNVKPAFGRGEAITIGTDPLEIVLVKNPSGFRLALHSYADTPAATMIAINDNYADGRDMSWLWDVPFESLTPSVAMVSGIRAYDMALRLQYDQIDVSHVDTDLAAALKEFIKRSTGRRRIYCTYTSMLAIRRELSKNYKVEAIE
ncbi:MAG: MurT ligase domain-containing protein [Candidatus Saccharimonadales bacterium]